MNITTKIKLTNNSIMSAKIELMSILKRIIESNKWTQVKAAKMLKLDQPKVSLIKNLKGTGFSLERILILLSRLNCEVEITVKKNLG